MISENRKHEIKNNRKELTATAEKCNGIKCLMVLEAFTSGDFNVKDLQGMVYKYTHAALGICEHPDWLEELDYDFKNLKEKGFL